MDQMNSQNNHGHTMKDGMHECDALKLNCLYCFKDYFVSGKFPKFFEKVNSHHCLEPSCLEKNKKEIWRIRRVQNLKEIDQGLERIKDLNKLNEVLTEMEEKAQEED
ncbi:10309_t:CDS:1 [Funneliformis geosporum]|nr:10309_t:CDS:1 [Funneliformis geosporum]